jgi:hypothetical protein
MAKKAYWHSLGRSSKGFDHVRARIFKVRAIVEWTVMEVD